MRLTEAEDSWCEWMRKQPVSVQERHDADQFVSISAFKAGTAAERARIQKALLTWHATDTGEETFPAAIVRICKEGV